MSSSSVEYTPADKNPRFLMNPTNQRLDILIAKPTGVSGGSTSQSPPNTNPVLDGLKAVIDAIIDGADYYF